MQAGNCIPRYATYFVFFSFSLFFPRFVRIQIVVALLIADLCPAQKERKILRYIAKLN